MLLAVENDKYNDALCKVVLLKDITENDHKDRLLKEALEQANMASKAKSEFLSNMSHEIRTPMNAILGITEIQLQNENLDQKLKEAFGKIYSSGDLLLGIINDILDLSKIESGKLELIIEIYESSSLINDTAAINMMRIGSKPITFELSVSEKIPSSLLGDELRIKQILNNILSNAFKYTEAGTVKLTVSGEDTTDEDDNVTLIFSISDTGQGMTKEQVDKLFDEYTRFNMDVNRTTEGTGLGMSITRNLIDMMSGKIFIDSQPGKGSVFTVHIPQKKNGDALIGKETAESLNNFSRINNTKMKRAQFTRASMPYGSVLVVDDVETNIYVAEGLLSPYGLRVDSSISGFDAIEKIQNGSIYDVIFMDHMMPKMDGFEATKIIRDMGYDSPIVALTANAVLGQADIFLGNGFDDFVSKPIDVKQLDNVLNKFIRDKYQQDDKNTVIKQPDAKNGSKSDNKPKTSGTRDFTEFFIRDAKKSLAILKELADKNNYKDEDNLKTYLINVHGMKSALANMGNIDLSEAAEKLEIAGRTGQLNIIEAETSGFYESLQSYVNELTPKSTGSNITNTDDELTYLDENLLLVITACESYDENSADELLLKLREKEWAPEITKLLDTIAELLLHSDFDELKKAVTDFL